MTKYNIDRLIRLKSAWQVMLRNRDHWSGNPAIENSVNNLEVEITFLDFVHTAQSEGSTPVTIGKHAYLEGVRAQVLSLAGSLATYANDTDDEELRSITDFSPSSLVYTREEAFLTTFRSLMQRAADIGTEVLTDYGIDEMKFNALTEMLENTNVTLRKPQLSIGELKALNAQVNSRFKRARFVLMRQLRNSLAPFRKGQPQFWNEFEAGLRVLNTGSRKSGADDVKKGS